MKIYTKTGDRGDTGLFGGPRVAKNAARIEAYGTIDELNAAVGLVRAETLPDDLDKLLAKVQNQLFDLGAELATPEPEKHGTAMIGAEQVVWQEEAMDRLQTQLTPFKEFILPGGTRAAAQLHMARCVCRRAERRLVSLADKETISSHLVVYLNRLSDLLFVLARYANHSGGVADVAWVKGA